MPTTSDINMNPGHMESGESSLQISSGSPEQLAPPIPSRAPHVKIQVQNRVRV